MYCFSFGAGQPEPASEDVDRSRLAVILPKRSWVKISQIRTLSTERIGRRLARVSDEDLVDIVEGLNEIIS